MVNTVNCEGYQGKGIAYQFKKRYPLNNLEYIKACRNKELTTGEILVVHESGKIIANFPTKNEWRKKSEYDYIEKGMKCLIEIIKEKKIKSIAMPPLGCGNGGLQWDKVKPIIERYINAVDNLVHVYVYLPSDNIDTGIREPEINFEHLLLLLFKNSLTIFNTLRLYSAIFIWQKIVKERFFNLDIKNNVLYSPKIEKLSKEIILFQDYYTVNSRDAETIIKNKIISRRIEKQLDLYSDAVKKSTTFINSIGNDKDLTVIDLILYFIDDFHKDNSISDDFELINFIMRRINNSSEITKERISDILSNLEKSKVIIRNLINIELNEAFPKFQFLGKQP
jgi:O-acetyl-ADP-ribose deacetylase (regulator of RNase III)